MAMSMVRSRHGSCNDTEEEEALWMGLQQRKNKNRYYRDAGTSPSPSPDSTTLIGSQPQQQQQQPQPRATKKMMDRNKAVDVVYYLSRNGILEQPHFMEVPLPSSAVALHLRDVIARLNSLRGRGLADMYSWSSKRNYKGGYVWQDLSEDDLIRPCNEGQEYVLKGSLLLQLPSSRSFRSDDTTPSPSPASKNSSSESPVTPKLSRNLGPVGYEARSTAEFVRNSTDASTQTDDDKRSMLPSSFAEELRKASASASGAALSSPPPGSSSSNEAMEDGMKRVGHGRDIRNQAYEGERTSGRMKAASSALMQLIMCVPKSAVDDGGVAGDINIVQNVPCLN